MSYKPLVELVLGAFDALRAIYTARHVYAALSSVFARVRRVARDARSPLPRSRNNIQIRHFVVCDSCVERYAASMDSSANAANDVEAMSIKEMKALIAKAGLSHADCFEKIHRFQRCHRGAL